MYEISIIYLVIYNHQIAKTHAAKSMHTTKNANINSTSHVGQSTLEPHPFKYTTKLKCSLQLNWIHNWTLSGFQIALSNNHPFSLFRSVSIQKISIKCYPKSETSPKVEKSFIAFDAHEIEFYWSLKNTLCVSVLYMSGGTENLIKMLQLTT